MSAIDYYKGSRIQNLGMDGTCSGIGGIGIVKSEGRNRESGTDTTGTGFRIGIGANMVESESVELG